MIKHVCACGCGEEIDRKGKRFSQKNHRIKWGRKLSNRGVLPVSKHIRCSECNCLMLLFPNTLNKSVCDSPACKKSMGDRRLKNAVKTTKERAELKERLTGQTPYRYGTAPIASEMQQRAIEFCEREGIRL